MRVIAALHADLEQSPLGTASRLGAELAGVPVLRRTVERLRRCRLVADIVVSAPAAQREAVRSLLNGLVDDVRPATAPAPSWLPLVRIGRKWSLDGWRGGIGGTTSFDEHLDPRACLEAAAAHGTEAVMSVNAASPVVDPVLLDRMIEHMTRSEDAVEVVFTQAPPGLAGVLLGMRLLRELTEKNVPLGWVFAYQPAAPQKDMLFLPCLCEVSAELRYAVGRCAADTDRSFRRLKRLLSEDSDPDALSVARFLLRDEQNHVDPLPAEVEIELTTEDAYPDTLLHPRGRRVPRRGPMDPGLVRRVVDELVASDDSRVVLGGCGDPLRHPQLDAVLDACSAERESGRRLFALAMRTTGVDLSDAVIEALIRHRVDVLNVILDAWTPDLYGRLHAPSVPATASLPAVRERLERLQAATFDHRSPCPVIVPEFTKALDNLHELDDFFDGWTRRFGAVVVRGFSQRGGILADRRAWDMAPPRRTACRRIASRCVILADGQIVACDEDALGYAPLGTAQQQPLFRLWNSVAFQTLREAHKSEQFAGQPLCAGCGEWFRP